MQQHQQHFVGKFSMRRRRPIVQYQFGVGPDPLKLGINVIEDERVETQAALQGATQIPAADQGVAHQGEAAGFHAARILPEELVIQGLRDQAPQGAVMLG